jgi:hypothetical protein
MGQEILAISVICNNWERKWEEFMHHGVQDRESISEYD